MPLYPCHDGVDLRTSEMLAQSGGAAHIVETSVTFLCPEQGNISPAQPGVGRRAAKTLAPAWLATDPRAAETLLLPVPIVLG